MFKINQMQQQKINLNIQFEFNNPKNFFASKFYNVLCGWKTFVYTER